MALDTLYFLYPGNSRSLLHQGHARLLVPTVVVFESAASVGGIELVFLVRGSMHEAPGKGFQFRVNV